MKSSLVDIADAIRSGQCSAQTALETSLDEIARHNAVVNAFVLVDEEGARQAANAIDTEIGKGGDPGPLTGVPIGVKDLREDCYDLPRRNGSLFDKAAEPATCDSPLIARLRSAGAVIVGKTATAEYGLDGVTHTLAHGTTRNPWNLQKTPSGSSGGSSAAVSAGMVPMAVGSDGFGSVRCPASFTGLIGLKPSLGRLPRVNGFGDTGTPGFLTTTVGDTARCMDIGSGPEDRDRMTLPALDIRYEDLIETLDVSGLRVVWSTDLGYAPVEVEVAEVCERAARQLVESAGLTLVSDQFSCTNAYVAWNALAAVGLRKDFEARGLLPDKLHALSPGPASFIEKYAYRDNARLNEYQQTVKQLEREVADLFARTDVLITPTAGCVAYAAEGPLPETIAGKDASQTNGEPFTGIGSIAWNPSVSVPAGMSRDGLPIGLLITVKRHRDDIALRLARLCEQVNPWPLHPNGY